MTAPTTTTAKQTWRDWLPEGAPEPDELLTRDELVARLRKLGVDADADDFRHWEGVRALPAAVKRWHHGAVRAVYPPWMVTLVVALRELQTDRMPLEDIGHFLREVFDEAIEASSGASDRTEASTTTHPRTVSLPEAAGFLRLPVAAVRRRLEEGTLVGRETPDGWVVELTQAVTPDPAVPELGAALTDAFYSRVLTPAVHAFHRRYERMTGKDVQRLTISYSVFRDTDPPTRVISFKTFGPDEPAPVAG